MSDILNLYNKSSKKVVTDARSIPEQKVNVVDINNEFSNNFETFIKRSSGTRFTDSALNFFDKLINDFTPPEDFTRLDPDIPPNRWNPSTKYYNPGQSSE